jgi:phosphoesterase RecJ-like protein
MGKSIDIICPSPKLHPSVFFLSGYKNIKTGIDFRKFDFSRYDLLISVDSPVWHKVSADAKIPIPRIPIVFIDHHRGNTPFGEINLTDVAAASSTEILFMVFEDWQVEIDKGIAEDILTGIIGDSGAFEYPSVTARTLDISSRLVRIGADKNMIIDHLYRSYPYSLVKFWGEVITNLKMDKKNKFVFSVVPFSVFRKFKTPYNGKETALRLFASVIEGVEFGFMILEYERERVAVSFRSKGKFNTIPIASELGGGGHVSASAACLEGPLEKTVRRVLSVARKYAKLATRKR